MDEGKATTTITINKVAQLQLRLNKPTKARLGHNSMMKQFQNKNKYQNKYQKNHKQQ